mmetsp:Transcript_5356/g.8766  ORF Transcript_5356/g.8766 Transcript_5356/m.8766 type:complete len:229 (-) Transcript_5356:5-691(-)
MKATLLSLCAVAAAFSKCCRCRTRNSESISWYRISSLPVCSRRGNMGFLASLRSRSCAAAAAAASSSESWIACVFKDKPLNWTRLCCCLLRLSSTVDGMLWFSFDSTPAFSSPGSFSVRKSVPFRLTKMPFGDMTELVALGVASGALVMAFGALLLLLLLLLLAEEGGRGGSGGGFIDNMNDTLTSVSLRVKACCAKYSPRMTCVSGRNLRRNRSLRRSIKSSGARKY